MKQLRASSSRLLVIWVSGWIGTSYYLNCLGQTRLENISAAIGRKIQSVAFPLAKKLDNEAMVDQMINECWWG